MTADPDFPLGLDFTFEASVAADRRVRVVFGTGSHGRVAPEVLRLGRRALLIAGRHEDDAAREVAERLGLAFGGRLRDVTEHVPRELATDAAAQAAAAGADVLVAIGGGSATGLAKAIALETGLPIVAVPTTYAGSEMTSIWGVTEGDIKTTGRDPRVLPRTVVYDPSLTRSLPASITAASGMNAMAHAIESLYAPDTDDRLSRVAEQAIRSLAQGIPASVTRPADLSARSTALYGAWLAGWALGGTTMGLHHRLAHVLGGAFRLSHAGTHSALLAQVASYNEPSAQPAFERAARALDLASAEHVPAGLFDLVARVRAPTSLAELGLPHEAVEQVARTVADDAVTNPAPITADGLATVLENAYDGTRPAAPVDRRT